MADITNTARRTDGRRKKFYKYAGLAAAVFVILLSAVSLLAGDRQYSNGEMRTLQTFPEITVSGFLSGQLSQEISAYASDQFAGRDAWIGIRTFVSRFFGQSVTAGVYRGSDGYLLPVFQEPYRGNTQQQTEDIVSFSDRYPSVNQYMILAPTSANVLYEKMPSGAPTYDECSFRAEIAAALDGSVDFVDVRKALLTHRTEYIYYKTDMHWTGLGAYYAFKEASSVMQLPASLDNFEAMPVTNDFQGTLQAASGYGRSTFDQINVYFYRDSTLKTVTEYDPDGRKSPSLYDSGALSGRNKYEVFFGGMNSLVHIETSADTGRRLLVFMDSDGSCFLPFLTPYFSEITAVDPVTYGGKADDLMTSGKITDVLYLYDTASFSQDTALSSVLENGN